MKRDYLSYCIFIYHSDTDESIRIFKEHILSKEQILKKDIDLLIESKCYGLLISLEGYYVDCSFPSHHIYHSDLKRFSNIQRKDDIIKYYQTKIPIDSFSDFINRLENIDVILDGGNIIYNGKDINIGKLEHILLKSFDIYSNPLIVIHCRHFKKLTDKKLSFISKYKDHIFMTPYGVYDDYYQILGMIFKNISIITNDMFRDHIFDMFKIFDSKNNQIKHYIESMCLTYGKNISTFRPFSNCIQYNDNYIYIPTDDGFFSIKYI